MIRRHLPVRMSALGQSIPNVTAFFAFDLTVYAGLTSFEIGFTGVVTGIAATTKYNCVTN